MNICKGIVKFPAGREFPSQFSNTTRQNVTLVLEDDTEISVWENTGHPFCRLQKGDKVDVIQTAKGYSIAESSIPNAAPQIGYKRTDPQSPIMQQQKAHNATTAAAADNRFSTSKIPPPEVVKEIGTYVEYLTRQYQFTFKQVCNQMQDENLKDELLKDIATSIFIQTNKKFMI